MSIDLRVAVVSIISVKNIAPRWLLVWNFRVGEYKLMCVVLECFVVIMYH